jgi:hypothetical protein
VSCSVQVLLNHIGQSHLGHDIKAKLVGSRSWHL